jgi:hypothetical protein
LRSASHSSIWDMVPSGGIFGEVGQPQMATTRPLDWQGKGYSQL